MKSLTRAPRRNRSVSKSLEKSLTRYALATASIAAVAIPSAAKADFSGAYDVGNWTFANTPTGTAGNVNTGSAPASITLTGGAAGIGGTSNFTIAAVASGMVSFNWSYSSTDSGSYDVGNFILNGAPIFLANNATQGAGVFTMAVNAGDTFGFQVFTQDGIAGPGVLAISNFNAPVPEGSTLGLLALGSIGVLVLMRRRLRSSV